MSRTCFSRLTLLLFVVSLALAQYDWTSVDAIFKNAIANRAFPGGTLTVADAKGILYQNAYGTLVYKTNMYEEPVLNSTKYEIASITKVIGTTAAIMELYNSGFIKITDPVTKYIPEYDNNQKRNTTIANLLLHNAGLPYDYPGALPPSPQDIITYIINSKPVYPIGSKFEYSNLGFILLGEIIHRITNRTVQDYYTQNLVFMGMRDTVFNPSPAAYYNIAPTQYDAELRQRIVRGEAHERLAYFLGGAAGHSGLFSTSAELVRFGRLMLNNGKIGLEPRVFSQASIALFTTKVEGLSYNNTRGYGFDTNCPTLRMSHCFGHDGSTGTMLWADASKNITFAVVTNRGHPNVNNQLFYEVFYNKVADQIMKVLGY